MWSRALPISPILNFLPSRLSGLGSAVSFQSGSWAKPRPKMNLMHFWPHTTRLVERRLLPGLKSRPFNKCNIYVLAVVPNRRIDAPGVRWGRGQFDSPKVYLGFLNSCTLLQTFTQFPHSLSTKSRVRVSVRVRVKLSQNK